MSHLRTVFVLLAFTAGSSCVRGTSAAELTVQQPSPREVQLTWKPATGDPAGHIVEYINHPTDEWVILDFAPRSRNTFTHPRLAPGTPYRYRVRPFFGSTSAPVEVTVARDLSDRAYAEAYAQPEDYAWATPRQRIMPGTAVLASRSVRARTTADQAAPGGLAAELMKTTVSGFLLTWQDRSSDEEGFLLEQVRAGDDFTVVAVIEPNLNTFGWALEPPVRRGTFRVRAYHFGSPSNVVSVLTGGTDAADLGSSPKASASAAR
jgi:hypothetical protein